MQTEDLGQHMQQYHTNLLLIVAVNTALYLFDGFIDTSKVACGQHIQQARIIDSLVVCLLVHPSKRG